MLDLVISKADRRLESSSSFVSVIFWSVSEKMLPLDEDMLYGRANINKEVQGRESVEVTLYDWKEVGRRERERGGFRMKRGG